MTPNPLHESIREAVAVLRNVLKTGSEDGRIRAAKELIATSPEYGTLREVLGEPKPVVVGVDPANGPDALAYFIVGPLRENADVGDGERQKADDIAASIRAFEEWRKDSRAQPAEKISPSTPAETMIASLTTNIARLTRKLAKVRHARDMARHDLRSAVKFAASIGEARDDAMVGNGRLAKEADELREKLALANARIGDLSDELEAEKVKPKNAYNLESGIHKMLDEVEIEPHRFVMQRVAYLLERARLLRKESNELSERLRDVGAILNDAIDQPPGNIFDTLRQLVAERDALRVSHDSYHSACMRGELTIGRAHGTLDLAKVPRDVERYKGYELAGARNPRETLTLAGRIAWLVDHGVGGAT